MSQAQRRISLLSLILLLNTMVFGVSLDCRKVKTSVEKIICADAELSALDANLSKIFQKTIQTKLYKEEIIKDQQIWQEIVRDKWCTTGKSDTHGSKQKIDSYRECLREAYRNRINILSLANQQYSLLQSQDKNICTPILDILNSDIETYGRFTPEKHSEFNWLQWENKYKLYNNPRGNGEAEFYPSAEFDINNDGKKEIVWHLFYYGKYGDEYEDIDYSPLKSFDDLNGSTTSVIFNSSSYQISYQDVVDSFNKPSLYIKPFKLGSSYFLALFGYSGGVDFGHHSTLYLTNKIEIVKFNKNNELSNVCSFRKNIENNKE